MKVGFPHSKIANLLECTIFGNLQERSGASLRRPNVLHRLWRHRPCPFVLSEPFFEAEERRMKSRSPKRRLSIDLSPAHHEVRAFHLKNRPSHPQTVANRLVAIVNTSTFQNQNWMSLNYEHSRSTRSAKDRCPSSSKRFETTPKC